MKTLQALLLLLFCSSIVWCPSTVQGQTSHQTAIDSLKKLQRAASTPLTKLDLAAKIAYEYRYLNPDSAENVARGVVRITETENIKCPVCLATAYSALGTSARQEGDFSEALVSYNQALAIYQSLTDQTGIASILDNIGLIHRKLGDYPKALSFLDRSFDIRTLNHDSVGLARSYACFAKVELDTDKLPQARKHLQDAIRIFKAHNLPYESASAFNDFGKTAVAEGKHEEALGYYMQAIEVWRSIGDKIQIVDSLTAFAAVFLEEQKYDKALEYIEMAISFMNKLNKKADAVELSYQKGLAYEGLKRQLDATKTLKQAALSAQELGLRRVELNCYRKLIVLDAPQAAYYQQIIGELQKARTE